MKTFILAALLALTAVSGVVVDSQPAAAMNPGRHNEGASRPAPIARAAPWRAPLGFCGTGAPGRKGPAVSPTGVPRLPPRPGHN